MVPRMVGLRLIVAKARIRYAGCRWVRSSVCTPSGAGTVLGQPPKATNRQLRKGAAISFVVSNGLH